MNETEQLKAARTARKTIEWIEKYKTADKEEENNRQGMLKELATYINGGKMSKSQRSLKQAKYVTVKG